MLLNKQPEAEKKNSNLLSRLLTDVEKTVIQLPSWLADQVKKVKTFLFLLILVNYNILLNKKVPFYKLNLHTL